MFFTERADSVVVNWLIHLKYLLTAAKMNLLVNASNYILLSASGFLRTGCIIAVTMQMLVI